MGFAYSLAFLLWNRPELNRGPRSSLKAFYERSP